jgi:hypothetical protein
MSPGLKSYLLGTGVVLLVPLGLWILVSGWQYIGGALGCW